MNTTPKFKIQTRDQNNNLHTAWTADGIGDQNEFESAAEARVAVRVRELRSYGDSWTECDYRIVGPNGAESAEMDADAWQYAIDAQLKRLGLSAIVANFDDDGLVELSDAEGCGNAMAPADLCALLEAIDADLFRDLVRVELASELTSL